MTDRIPIEVLDAAHRNLCRRVVACIAQAMAEEDCSFDTIDKRCGFKSGHARDFVFELLEGNTKEFRIPCDLATAMGTRIEIGFHKLFTQQPEAISTEPKAQEP